MAAGLGGETWYRLARKPGDEDLIQRWLATRAPDVRRAFLAALLIVDGQATIQQVIDGWARLPAGRIILPDPEGELAEQTPVYVVPRLCEHCGQPLPDYAGFGRPPNYHEACRPLAAASRRAEARRAAKDARENGLGAPESDPAGVAR